LLIGLTLALRFSLRPLQKVEEELLHIESGQQDALSTNYPSELEGVVENLNALVRNERNGLNRYRRTLGDLAHSLKTPLAVIQGALEADEDIPRMRQEIGVQIERMNAIVMYQLQRAATRGHQTLSRPLPIQPFAEEIVSALEKVHRAKGISCGFEIAANAEFTGERGDLSELLGNLLENAFKWGKHEVLLTAQPIMQTNSKRSGLLLIVEDDGPGIPPEKAAELLQRGVRGDERVQGHGIGLSIVDDVVRAYHGELEVMRSQLGGAKFVIKFHPRGLK
jgi:two-component system, OmpR family, sensor histidine kinase PhoQ